MAKMNKKWVVLCSTAIAAVYATGYYSTEAQANKIDMQQNAQIHSQSSTVAMNTTQLKLPQTNTKITTKTITKTTPKTTTNIKTKTVQSRNSSPNISQSKTKQSITAPAKTVQIKRIYKNGTFTGMGENRRGSIQVAVKIENDRIMDVEISDFGMHYSESDIVGLPGEVLKRQNAQVSNVSGATYSTQAFQDAVLNALYQAKNA
ncbi:MAG: FMN-binding protein [Bacillota bacterium]|nr:FMN-binding protein [Bacillota bacterium]